jgi:hypothetical protein
MLLSLNVAVCMAKYILNGVVIVLIDVCGPEKVDGCWIGEVDIFGHLSHYYCVSIGSFDSLLLGVFERTSITLCRSSPLKLGEKA